MADVTLIGGIPRVSSLDMATKFGKRHSDVLRTIQNITLDLPREFNQRNFALVEYADEKDENRPAFVDILPRLKSGEDVNPRRSIALADGSRRRGGRRFTP